MKIYFATTFRGFNSSYNDDIQSLFIRSIISSYSDYHFIITQFGEQNVEESVKHLIPNDRLTYFENNTEYNHNEVVINAMKHLSNFANGEGLLIWTTADLIYSSVFFEVLLDKLDSDSSFILYPNLHTSNLETLKSKIFKKTNIYNDGIDLVGFTLDSDLDSILFDMNTFKTVGYGYFEYILSLSASLHTKNRFNVSEFREYPIKVENSIEIVKDGKTSRYTSSVNNKTSLIKFLKYHGLRKHILSGRFVDYHFSKHSLFKQLYNHLIGLYARIVFISYEILRRLRLRK
jgi:hypothetical protein